MICVRGCLETQKKNNVLSENVKVDNGDLVPLFAKQAVEKLAHSSNG